ncbi:hypothetical protein [Dyadobacter aurulentus]|uniref:hypothetical protein n=1 Tax=Dyadobacter sp. UC 10 TaxID=2605428 RepID=UPI0011F395F5|nr:hypothetical protein [Dyadobacter sp. UC 10]KAA0989874.1 hypothetical protein FXO21_06710 [Dyadobacter sp. UC 10]
MKKISILLTALPLLFIGCKEKKEVEPAFQFYQTIGGDTDKGRSWKLAHFYSNIGLSNYENTVENGIDGADHHPDWVSDNYYTFFKNGYGLCFEVGVINPQVNVETEESYDPEAAAYKYIQFDYGGGKTVNITNRVQKPAFFGEWDIVSVTSDEIVLYQQEKEYNQEHVIVFKSTRGGI